MAYINATKASQVVWDILYKIFELLPNATNGLGWLVRQRQSVDHSFPCTAWFESFLYTADAINFPSGHHLAVQGLDNESDFAISMMSDNTAKLTSAVNSLPQLLEKKRLIDMHTTIATGQSVHSR